MENGKKMSERVMELITTQTETDIKEIGITIFKAELALIIIQMEIFIRESGWMGSPMGKEITYITGTKESTKEIGKMVKNKDLDSWSSMTNMVTQENGEKTRKMVEVLIFTLMAKDIKVVGQRTKNKEKEFIGTGMEICMMGIGKMTGDRVKDLWTITMGHPTREIGLKASNKEKEDSCSLMGIFIKANGNQAKCMEEVFLLKSMDLESKAFGSMENLTKIRTDK